MKLNFLLTQTTSVTQPILIERILEQVNKPAYKIVDRTDKIVAFKHNVWRFASRGEMFKYVDGGVFEIIISDNKPAIKFTYYISMAIEILLLAISFICGLLLRPFCFIWFAAILIQFIARIEALKSVSKKMLQDVTVA